MRPTGINPLVLPLRRPPLPLMNTSLAPGVCRSNTRARPRPVDTRWSVRVPFTGRSWEASNQRNRLQHDREIGRITRNSPTLLRAPLTHNVNPWGGGQHGVGHRPRRITMIGLWRLSFLVVRSSNPDDPSPTRQIDWEGRLRKAQPNVFPSASHRFLRAGQLPIGDRRKQCRSCGYPPEDVLDRPAC